MSEIIALLVLVIYFSNVKSGLEAYFRLNLNRFFNDLFLNIKFSTFLFYLRFYGGFKAFSEKFDKVRLF